jgi:hypothetical protein
VHLLPQTRRFTMLQNLPKDKHINCCGDQLN